MLINPNPRQNLFFDPLEYYSKYGVEGVQTNLNLIKTCKKKKKTDGGIKTKTMKIRYVYL